MNENIILDIKRLIIDKLVLAILAGLVLGGINYKYWEKQTSHDNGIKRIDQKIETSSVLISNVTGYLTSAEEFSRQNKNKQDLTKFLIITRDSK